MKKMRWIRTLFCTIGVFSLMAFTGQGGAYAVEPIQLIVDGNDITALSNPIIENDRVLVPLRFITEEIGAEIIWDSEKRTVSVEKDDRNLLLWIDSRLVAYNNGGEYQLSDVAPKIINERTYVPLRLVSNALGVGIAWDGEERTVTVNSSETSVKESFYEVKIISLRAKELITEETQIAVSIPAKVRDQVRETQLIFIDPETAKGFVVAREAGAEDLITYLPKTEDWGEKVLVLALYDKNRKFIGGDAIPVRIGVNPQVTLLGVEAGAVVDSVTMDQAFNFLPEYVNYELTNLGTGKVTTISERDPQGTYTWIPTMEKNGSYLIKAIAYDGNGSPYESEGVPVTFAVERKLALKGVSTGKTINKPVTLLASRNFDVKETTYMVRDLQSGMASEIATVPYGEYQWFPGAEYSGEKELFVRVTDVDGVDHVSEPIRVNIDGSPRVYLHGVGPKEVITKWAKLSVSSNVDLESVTYIMTNRITGERRVLAEGQNPDEAFKYDAVDSDAGNMTIHAEAMGNGKKYESEKIAFTIYRDTLYGAKAIIERDQFLGFASNLALDSFQKTGMSAALQTAQAILETASGQRLPVDRYSGKFSYNLFGIKGSADNGSVTCSTWEVYNGMTYHVDADFRAYNNIDESWADHKRILLELSRYEPFRDVMYDSTQGAWAIRRAGYATDPKYPMKLINIIKKYDLEKLDEVGIQ